MERREFLKLTLGFTAAAGSIAAMATAAQAAPMLPPTGDMGPPVKADVKVDGHAAGTAAQETTAATDHNAVEDTDMSARAGGAVAAASGAEGSGTAVAFGAVAAG